MNLQSGVYSLVVGFFFVAAGLGSIDLAGWNSFNTEMDGHVKRIATEAAKLLPDDTLVREFVYAEAKRLTKPDVSVLTEVLMPYENSGNLEVRLYTDYRAVTTPFLKGIRRSGGHFRVEKRFAVETPKSLYGRSGS